MNLLPTTISRSLDAVSWTPEAVFPDAGNLLPLAVICLASIFCTALWLLAVSGYVSRGRVYAIH